MIKLFRKASVQKNLEDIRVKKLHFYCPSVQDPDELSQEFYSLSVKSVDCNLD